ncbi:nuclear transport factor 2 family protein [Streptomyces sp. NPDC048825]|uniref:nuclear transport factor 2 family protein n=1 Tax=Streptomyces sp. NPDC048825 TaxID=3365592 RepID=UPI0037117F71
MTYTELTATEDVAAALQEYAAAWTALDLQRVADQWDRQDPEVTYIAEELGEVLVGPERISEHLLRTEHRISASSVSLRDVHVRELAPGLALATFICRWEFEWVTYSRVSALLRRRDMRWLFTHYMEAPFHMEDWDSRAERDR